MPETQTDSRYVIDIKGDVSGMVAAGKYVYQHQVNVEDGGLVYLLDENVVPFRKVPLPVRAVPRAEPPLIGRLNELESVHENLRPGGTVQITGPEGVGKTTLLVHLAHEEMPQNLDAGVVHLRVKNKPLADVLMDLFYGFHDSALPTPFVPPPVQVARAMEGIQAVILVDDVEPTLYEVGELLDSATSAAFAITTTASVSQIVEEVRLEGLPTEDSVALFNRTARRPDTDREAVSILCDLLGGHPDCVLLAARHVRDHDVSPADLATGLLVKDPCHALAVNVLESIPTDQTKAARFLAALGGTAVSVNQVESATGVATLANVNGLANAGIAVANSPAYLLNPLLLAAAEELWDLDDVRAEVISWLLYEIKSRDQGGEERRLTGWVDLVVQVLEIAESTGEPGTVVKLGRAADPLLSRSGRWGVWSRVLRAVEMAARANAQEEALAWALHQQGTQSICYGQNDEAVRLLTQALEIRTKLASATAIETTRHNLEVARLPPDGFSNGPDASDSVVPPNSLLRTLGILAAGAVVGAVGWFLVGVLNSGDGMLEAEPMDIDFEEVVEDSSATRQVFLSNRGDAVLELVSIGIEGHDTFTVKSDCAAAALLEPDQSCVTTVSFDPSEAGIYEAVLLVRSSDNDQALRISLEGRGLAEGRLEVSSDMLDFGSVEAGSASDETLGFENTGDVPIVLDALSIDSATNFVVLSDDCGSVLEARSFCSATVQFAPNLEGEYEDLLTMGFGGGGGFAEVTLRGVGFGEAEIRADPATIDLGEFFVTDRAEMATSFENDGSASTVLSFRLDDGDRFELGDSTCGGELAVGDRCEITVLFRPLTTEEALPDFVADSTTSLVQFAVLSASKRYSDVLTVRSDGDPVLEIQLTGLALLPMPDLVSQIDEVVSEGFDGKNDYPIYRITAQIGNAGRVASSSGLIGVEIRIGELSPMLLPLVVGPEDERAENFEPVIAENIEPLTIETIQGIVIIPFSELEVGTPIEMTVIADACGSMGRPGVSCQVLELNEENNQSKPVGATVPWRFPTLIPLPPFVFDPGILFEQFE